MSMDPDNRRNLTSNIIYNSYTPPELRCAFEPAFDLKSVGVEAIFECLRLADIRGFKMRSPSELDGNDEPTDRPPA